MIDVGISGKDLKLETREDYSSLIGSTWVDSKSLERRVHAIRDLRESRSFPGQFVGDVHWVRPHWASDAQPGRQWLPYFLRWIRKATCTAVANKEVSP